MPVGRTLPVSVLPSAHHCAPAEEGVTAGLSLLHNSVCLSAPANPAPGGAGGAERGLYLFSLDRGRNGW